MGCVEKTCVLEIGSSNESFFGVHDPALTNPEKVDVSVSVMDHGRVVFDATRLLQLHEWRPNESGCDLVVFDGRVLATPEGDLIPL
jgi:hypothetical protein